MSSFGEFGPISGSPQTNTLIMMGIKERQKELLIEKKRKELMNNTNKKIIGSEKKVERWLSSTHFLDISEKTLERPADTPWIDVPEYPKQSQIQSPQSSLFENSLRERISLRNQDITEGKFQENQEVSCNFFQNGDDPNGLKISFETSSIRITSRVKNTNEKINIFHGSLRVQEVGVKIKNVSPFNLTFKIYTSNEEKFKMMPKFGWIPSNATEEITITSSQDPDNLTSEFHNDILKENFRIMTAPVFHDFQLFAPALDKFWRAFEHQVNPSQLIEKHPVKISTLDNGTTLTFSNSICEFFSVERQPMRLHSKVIRKTDFYLSWIDFSKEWTQPKVLIDAKLEADACYAMVKKESTRSSRILIGMIFQFLLTVLVYKYCTPS